jgi:large subunit ribosomal protein L18
MVKPKHIDIYRRRREGKTDYKRRLTLLKSRKPRLIVRKSEKHTCVQIVEYAPEGDKVLASAFSKELQKLGWKYSCSNLPSTYLTGLLCATRAKKAKANEAIFDIGLNNPLHGSRLYAALKGAVDGGLQIPLDESALPSDERISGTHIAKYAEELQKKGKTLYEKQFSANLKAKADPTKLNAEFEKVKKSILGGSK